MTISGAPPSTCSSIKKPPFRAAFEKSWWSWRGSNPRMRIESIEVMRLRVPWFAEMGHKTTLRRPRMRGHSRCSAWRGRCRLGGPPREAKKLIYKVLQSIVGHLTCPRPTINGAFPCIIILGHSILCSKIHQFRQFFPNNHLQPSEWILGRQV